MMKKIVNKFLIILVMLFVFFNFISFPVLATDYTGSSAVDRYNSEEIPADPDSPTVWAENIIGRIIFIMQIILLALALIMLTVIGIKFICGSIEEKAEIKKHIALYVFGAILLFSASGIVSLLRRFFINII